MTTATATLDEVFDLVTKLSPDDQRQLVERLNTRIIETRDSLQARREIARKRRAQFRKELLAYGPVSPTAGEILDEDRRHRDTMLMGTIHQDVHD